MSLLVYCLLYHVYTCVNSSHSCLEPLLGAMRAQGVGPGCGRTPLVVEEAKVRSSLPLRLHRTNILELIYIYYI